MDDRGNGGLTGAGRRSRVSSSARASRRDWCHSKQERLADEKRLPLESRLANRAQTALTAVRMFAMLETLLLVGAIGLIVGCALWLIVLSRNNPLKVASKTDHSAAVAASRLAAGERNDRDHGAAPVVNTDQPT